MQRYVLSARVLHWLMAAGFFFMWGCGYVMTELVEEDSPLEELLFSLHISVGVTLLALLIARVFIRFRNKPPAMEPTMKPWEKAAAHAGHFSLYLLPAVIIAIGWAESDFGGHGVGWFGLAMPKFFPTMETLWGFDLETTTATLHKWLAYGMLALVVVHIGAALKHQYRDGHRQLEKMSFGKRKG